jgi:ASC-1-like (ASCH) protein
MKKSWGLTQKVLIGEKQIESRWYMTKARPWGIISAGDTVYFKDSGSPVTVKAEVSKVLQFSDLTQELVSAILSKYAENNGLGVVKENIQQFYELFKNKKYCLLIFLKNPKKVKPFEIDKSGFGAMAAWITIDKLSKVKLEV